jgi:hypothetical protein
MSDSADNPVLLTLADVMKIKEEREAAAVAAAEAAARVRALDAKLDAIRLWLPDTLAARVFPPETSDEGDGLTSERKRKWAPTVMGILRESTHGLTTADIRARLVDTPLFDQAGRYGNALYNALSKMVAKGDLLKDGEYYCLPGQSRPENAPKRPASQGGYEQAIKEVLGKTGGLKSGDIIGALRQTEFGSGLGKSTGYFYSVLNKMLATGALQKEGRMYSLPPEANEPSDGDPQDSSDVGEEDDPRSSPSPFSPPTSEPGVFG